MGYSILNCGTSRSFPVAHSLLEQADGGLDILLIIGADAGKTYCELADKERYGLILIELGNECLGVHTGESRGIEGSNILGFARFRLGQAEPSSLVEIVRQSATPEEAVTAACELFEAHGLITAVCQDFLGKIGRAHV